MRKKMLATALAAAVTTGVSIVGLATPAHAAAQTIREGDLITNLNDVRSSGHYEFTGDGIDVWTDDNSSNAKVALYWPGSGGLPDTVTMDWFGTQPQPGTQVVFDMDSDRTNANTYNILVGEPVYGDDFWYTGGQARAAQRGFTCPQTSGGFGGDCHGTLAEWQAVPELANAEVYAYGFSLGSGIKGSGHVRNLEVNDTTKYHFTNQPAPVNADPVARFSVDKDFRSVAFDGTDSSDAEGPIASYSWNFGDGDTSTEASPTHVYDTAGTYQVSLTVTDGDNATNTRTKSVTVRAEPQQTTPVVPTAYHNRTINKRTATVYYGTQDAGPNQSLEREVQWTLRVDGQIVQQFSDGFGEDHYFQQTFGYHTGTHRIILRLDDEVVRNFTVSTNRR